jgi:2-aminoadipate transaminase
VPEGGLFIWGQFDKGSGIDAAGSFRRAIENKVAYVSGNDFFSDGSGRDCVRLNFSNVSHEKLVEGVKRLAQVFSQK